MLNRVEIMEKLMEVLEAKNIDKNGVVLLGQNGKLDILTEEKLKQYIGDSITLCLTNGDTFKLRVIGIDRMYPCFSPESPLIIGICVGYAIDSVNVEKGQLFIFRKITLLNISKFYVRIVQWMNFKIFI